MIKLDATYSDYVNTTDPKYPAGKAVDASGEENTDGTPLLAKWMNDINGTRQAIIKEAFGNVSGVSGVPDDVENSDVLKALKKITQDYTNGKVANEAQARVQGDTNTLNFAKSYTDSKVSIEAQARSKGDTNTLSSAKSYVDQKFIKHYQKGYLQMPGMPSPLEDTSMHYEGYSWYEVNYDGNFFRAKGRSAKAFSTKKLTKQQIKNGIYAFRENEQGDAIRNIKGVFEAFRLAGDMVPHLDSALFGEKAPTAKTTPMYSSERDNKLIKFDASKVVPTAEENRSRNLTFTFWVLIKNE